MLRRFRASNTTRGKSHAARNYWKSAAQILRGLIRGPSGFPRSEGLQVSCLADPPPWRSP